ncbi:MAG: hypothetical protein EA361_14895 [Bacteroidetes bacterium]|nr:MAG: hypothetical protein EA361_14895 [Bacteroidota bacterium]
MRNERSTSKTRSLVWVLTVLLAFNLKACNNNQVDYPEGSIIMTTTAKELRIVLSGSDDITIHWGDGKKSNLNEGTLLNFNEGMEFSHTYSFAAKRTIYITGKVEKLRCDNMQLTVLDVSQNVELTSLNCSDNHLTALDMSRNTALTTLACNNNPLTTFDVSKNTALEELIFGGNQSAALDVSRNTALKYLTCSDTQITHLDVSANTALLNLHICSSQITKLEVNKNPDLKVLCVRRNQLTASALNDLFYKLPEKESHGGAISISGNPGARDCDRSIAEKKGWVFANLHR